jgi:hypothetical protein
MVADRFVFTIPRRDVEAAQEALERYCCVDTLAMFYVLDYWAWRLAEGGGIGSDASPDPLMP